jgi:hypothetical protein
MSQRKANVPDRHKSAKAKVMAFAYWKGEIGQLRSDSVPFRPALQG